MIATTIHSQTMGFAPVLAHAEAPRQGPLHIIKANWLPEESIPYGQKTGLKNAVNDLK